MNPSSPGPPPAAGRSHVSRWHFADCILDAEALELSVQGRIVRLEPKPLEVLSQLLHRAGEVVTKDELQERVWPDRIYSDSVLTKAIAKLRLALQDEDQAIIKTVHGYGYRLVAPVRAEWSIRRQAEGIPGLQRGTTPPQRPEWRLVEQLGVGGYGDVWLGRHHGSGDTRVFKFAVDVPSLAALKREITLSRLLRQTHGERLELLQVLGWNLEDPPYFIEVEHVAGGSLTQWAQARGGLPGLPLALRLDLAAQAAEALALAHAAGVLHKDLKPSNLLIATPDAAVPRVKLGDFGSARLVDLARLEQLEITRLGFTRSALEEETSGTPLYLAPELLAGQLPTVRSDLFALGMLLFQLAVADLSRPLAPGWEGEIDDDLLREDIAAAAAIRPDDRLADAGELARRIRQLPMRHAQRTAQRRDAEDAGRLREALEQARQRRSRALSLAAVFGLGALIATWQGLAARSARLEADRQRERAQQQALASAAVSRFLVEDLIAAANPQISGRPDLPVRDALRIAEERVPLRFAAHRDTEAAVRRALGSAWFGLGDHERARPQLLAALAHLPDRATQAEVELQLGLIATELNEIDEASTRLATALAGSDAGSETRLDAELHLAWLDNLKGDYAASEAKLIALRPRHEQRFGIESPSSDKLLEALGSVQINAGKLEEGVATLKLNLDRVLRRHGERDPRAINARTAYVGALNWAERDAEALPIIEANCRNAAEVLGTIHIDTLRCRYWHGQILYWLKRLPEARDILVPTLDRLHRDFGESHPTAIEVLTALAKVTGEMGDRAKELLLLQRVLDIQRQALGDRHDSVLQAGLSVAKTLLATGQTARAEARFREILDIALADYGTNRLLSGELRTGLADTLIQQKQFDEAGPLLALAEADLREATDAENTILKRVFELQRRLASGSGQRASRL